MRFKHPALMTESDCAAYAQIALENDNADTRREAVVCVGQSRYVKHDTVVRALVTVVQNDSSPSVRHAAVHVLSKAGTPPVIDPLLDIVAEPDEAPSVQRDPTAEVRYAAMQGLDGLLVRGDLSAEQPSRCRDACLRLIAKNPSRDVRIAAARLLRHYRERPVADILIDNLAQRDFGVVYESDRSLMHLTGRRLNHDAAAWRAWLASAPDPFAEAGALDGELYPPDKSWWDQTRDSALRTLAGYGPK